MGKKDDVHVVIVGGGLSGLSAADRLINNYGFQNVTILEALDRFGGRVHPVKFRDGYLQMGAEWIHGSGNLIYDLATKLGLLPNDSESFRLEDLESTFRDESGMEISNEILDKFMEFKEDIEETLEDMVDQGVEILPESIGGVYDEAFASYLKDQGLSSVNSVEKDNLIGMFNWTRKLVEIEHAASDWHRISFRTWSKYVELPEEDELTMNKIGYQGILDYMENRVTKAKLHLLSRVVNIDWSELPLKVSLSNQETILADHVIVTCPLGHLQEYGLDLFTPHIPFRKWSSIQTMGFDSVSKIEMIINDN